MTLRFVKGAIFIILNCLTIISISDGFDNEATLLNESEILDANTHSILNEYFSNGRQLTFDNSKTWMRSKFFKLKKIPNKLTDLIFLDSAFSLMQKHDYNTQIIVITQNQKTLKIDTLRLSN